MRSVITFLLLSTILAPALTARCEAPAPADTRTAAHQIQLDTPASALGLPVPSALLDSQRAGDENLVNNMAVISGEVTGNTAQDVTTGANSIEGGSFAHSSGITTVVQNTGANVLIQSATIVNVEFTE